MDTKTKTAITTLCCSSIAFSFFYLIVQLTLIPSLGLTSLFTILIFGIIHEIVKKNEARRGENG